MSGSTSAIKVEVLERVPELDGIRGMALCMVLWIHCFIFSPDNLLLKFNAAIAGSMFIALDLFFVLSGFLITGILLRTQQDPHRARNFYVRRVLRVFPAYYAVIAFVFLLYPHMYSMADEMLDPGDSIYYIFYVQNIWLAWTDFKPSWPGLQHLFSMAIEEQFYMLWPLVVWFTPNRHLLKVCSGLFLFSVLLKLVMIANGTHWLEIYLPTYTRLEGLAAGAGLAVLWEVHGVRRSPRWLTVLGTLASLALLFLIFRKYTAKATSPLDLTAHLITASVAFAWMIFSAVSLPQGASLRRFLRNRVLRFLGRYSYGIYLIHWIIYFQVKEWVRDPLVDVIGLNAAVLLAGMAITGLSILLAMLMYHALEAPALSLKRYFAPRTTKGRS